MARILKSIKYNISSTMKFSIAVIFFTFNFFIQAAQPLNLSVEMALKKAMKNSYEIKDVRFDERLANIDYKSTISDLFLPRVSIEASHDIGKNFTKIVSEDESFDEFGFDEVDEYSSTKYSEISLNIENLNLFNSGRDYINAQIAKLNKEIASVSLKNRKLSHLLNVYKEYYFLKSIKERINTVERGILISESFLDLAKALRGKSDQDQYAIQSDISAQKQESSQLKRDYKRQLFFFNILLGDPVGKEYVLDSDFPDVKLKTKGLSYKYLSENSVEMITGKKFLEQAKLDQKLVRRNIYPYMQAGISGFRRGSARENGERFRIAESTQGTRFLNFSVQVGIRIPIWGGGGFMSRWERQRARIGIQRAENDNKRLGQDLTSEAVSGFISLKTINSEIDNLTQRLTIQESRLSAAMKSFQENARTSSVNTREAIFDLTRASQELFDKKVEKISLVTSLMVRLPLKTSISKVLDTVMKH